MGAFLSGLGSGLSGSGGVDKFIDKMKQKKHHSSKMGAGDDMDPATPQIAHHGAKIRKGGKIKVLKGERVLTKKQAKKYAKKMRGK
jgi:hypothetical protein